MGSIPTGVWQHVAQSGDLPVKNHIWVGMVCITLFCIRCHQDVISACSQRCRKYQVNFPVSMSKSIRARCLSYAKVQRIYATVAMHINESSAGHGTPIAAWHWNAVSLHRFLMRRSGRFQTNMCVLLSTCTSHASKLTVTQHV